MSLTLDKCHESKTLIIFRNTYPRFFLVSRSFLASGFGGQIIGVVPSLDLMIVIKFETEDPVDPVKGTAHDDMYLFELVVRSAG